jgi:PAS domain S-box-containing protein
MSAELRVLYAENDAVDADLTKEHFAGAARDIVLEVVDNGEQCLARLAQWPYDVLLLDHQLPDMDGVDVLREMAARQIQLPVVVVTGVGDEALVVQVLNLGACDYVPKHGNYLDTLPAVLERAFNQYHRLRSRHYAPDRRGRRILYVEHDSADIDLTSTHFAEAAPHFSLTVARSSAEALALLQRDRFDLVLTDLRMPDMNALDLLWETKNRNLWVPVVVITGRGDERTAVAALRLGASDYIVKRDNYLTQLPYAIDNAIVRFQLVQLNQDLEAELSARRRSQKATIESLELLDTLQRHAPIGIAFMDRDYRYQRVNDEFAAINGVPPEAHLGRTVADVIPAIWPQLQPICLRVLAGETVLKVEISGETPAKPGETRHFLSSFYPIRRLTHEVIGIGVFVAETTERKRAEAVLREHAAELAEAAREKDEFLAMLGHELRNPLEPIRTALTLLQRSGSQDPLVVRAQEVMDRQITHMVRLLDDLLDVARITNGRINLAVQEVDLRQIVREATDSVRGLIDARRHHLETSLPPDPVRVRGDVTRLVQVVVNLLNNAAKYTDENGTIRVDVAAEPESAVLRVADTGTGISARLLPKIFDLFTQDDRTLDRAQGGLGLGLTLVRRITELHGGSVEAHSEGRGRGSEFVVRLPLHVTDAAATAPSTGAARPSARSIRCLVVEDNVDAAQLLQFALEDEGHQVRVTFDGVDAVAAAAEFQPDAVILDIGLPRMNGYDAARAIRAIPGLSDIVIIALTGYGQDTDRQKSREAGCDHHFVKPIDLTSLFLALDAGRTAWASQ